MFAAINAFLTSAVSGYFLNKSLRFRSSASAYLNRTPAVAGNRRTFTISYWAKRGTLGTSQYVFAAGSGTTESTWFATSFDTNGTSFDAAGSSTWTNALGSTTALFRDPAAWYHFVWAVDTTQAVASDRSKIYVNGVLQTSLAIAVAVTQNADLAWNNSGVVHYIGARIDGGPRSFFDGEMAEINSVDGQALTPTSFGATGANSQWLPVKYAGTYGTNGFYLPFSNTTSTSTLVADSSGNANNWTPNNISLTAGSTYDSLTDVPTLTSTTVANYAVLNPLDAATTTGVSSNGNLTWTNAAVTHQCIRGSIAIPATGAYYFEATNLTANSATIGMAIGLGASTASLSVDMGGSQTNIFSFYSGGNANSYLISGTTTLATFVGGAFSAGDLIQLAVDTTNTKMWLGKNNVWYNNTGATTGNPSTGANPTFTTSMVGLFPMTEAFGNTVNFNFGQRPFAYTAPSGFLPLNTFNIAAGTVTTSGTFTGNLSTDGPFVFLNGTPTTMTINGNAVTFGTQADKLANGFKVRSSSVLYNLIGSNTYTASVVGAVFKYEDAQSNP